MNTLLSRLFKLCLILMLAAISIHTSRVAVLLGDLNQSNREIINAHFLLADSCNRLAEEVASLQDRISGLTGKGLQERSSKKGGAQ